MRGNYSLHDSSHFLSEQMDPITFYILPHIYFIIIIPFRQLIFLYEKKHRFLIQMGKMTKRQDDLWSSCLSENIAQNNYQLCYLVTLTTISFLTIVPLSSFTATRMVYSTA